MKKHLLIGGIMALAVSTVSAQNTPVLLGDYDFVSASPNGNWVLAYNGNPDLFIFDISDINDVKKYAYTLPDPTVDPYTYYSAGYGTCISNSGIVVGNKDYNCQKPVYWENGTWKALKRSQGDEDGTSQYIPHGISSDGKVICGLKGLAGMGTEDLLMAAPCIWVRDDNGEYGYPQTLPYPGRDIAGAVPQYITALSVSDDGKLVAGQILDNTGFLCQPIIYIQDEEGNWKYKTLANEIINPDGLKPVNPGYGPDIPNIEAFLTEEDQERYDEALEEYENDPSVGYPDLLDFMSEESKAAYEAAWAIYQEEYDAWWEKYSEYRDMMNEMEAEGVFCFNNMALSPDGHYLASPLVKTEDMMVVFSHPVLFDLSGDEVTTKIFDCIDIKPYVTQVDNQGRICGVQQWNELSPAAKGYIQTVKDGDFIFMGDYINSFPSMQEWVKKYLEKTFEIYVYDADEETYVPTDVKEILAGRTLMLGENLDKFIVTVDYVWDDETLEEGSTPFYYAYYITLPSSGVYPVIEKCAASLAISKEGVVSVKGDAKSLVVYDVNGSKVAEVASPADNAAALSTGIYLLKLEDLSGAVKTIKAYIR